MLAQAQVAQRRFLRHVYGTADAAAVVFEFLDATDPEFAGPANLVDWVFRTLEFGRVSGLEQQATTEPGPAQRVHVVRVSGPDYENYECDRGCFDCDYEYEPDYGHAHAQNAREQDSLDEVSSNALSSQLYPLLCRSLQPQIPLEEPRRWERGISSFSCCSCCLQLR